MLVDREDIDLASTVLIYGAAGGEVGFELAAVAVGGDVVELDDDVAAVEAGAAAGDGVVGDLEEVGLLVGDVGGDFVNVVDKGRVLGCAGARGEVGGAGGDGGGEEGGGEEGGGDGEDMHFCGWREGRLGN